jgi:acyl-CoA synthetase (AMP-forming)/AMP-acid ligase II
MAEATLLISGVHWQPTSEPRPGPVSCGSAADSCHIQIVDPELSLPCPAGIVGEIWVSGPSIASGYWQQPEATRQTFGAELPTHPGQRWLRTGDLGFMRNGEVYPTGRLKDLIIVRGANHYPDDIEATVKLCWPGLNSTSVAAFALDVDSEPELVVAIELGRGRVETQIASEISTAVRIAIAAEHGLSVSAMVVVPVGALPRTSSGKLRRGACRDHFSAGDWDAARLESVVARATGPLTEPAAL